MTLDLHPAFLQRVDERLDRDTINFPSTIARFIKRGHTARIGVPANGTTSPVAYANRWARITIEELKASNLHRAYDEQAIRDCAENRSRLAGRLDSRLRESFVKACGLDLPHGRTISCEGAQARMACIRWWRRGLRSNFTRAAENNVRRLGLIRKGRSTYISDHAVQHRRSRQLRTARWLESRVMVNELGEQLELLSLSEHSIANPEVRNTEMMVRVRGFEEIADYHRHVAEFYTLTCPSTFHAQMVAAGENPKYQRQTVRDAQAWLCSMWAKARAKFKRLSILCYGFRVAEPHHDGTPHWHLLLFYPPGQAETVRFVLRSLWLSVDGSEPGAAEHRFKVETIDASRGSAAGYIAKYIAKNINSKGAIGEATDTETGERVSDGTIRVITWASVHGIRQFQQIGGPAIGLWRECRRLREEVADIDIERCRAQADAGSFAGFIHSVGGIAIGRRTGLRLEKVETGLTNYYGEQKPPQIVGIRYASALEITRPHQWTIKPKDISTSTLGRATANVSDVPAGNLAGLDSACFSHPHPVVAKILAAVASLPLATCREADRDWLRALSDLGPVAITVRGDGNPAAWTNPNETSMYGP
jgi:hypothetical protein